MKMKKVKEFLIDSAKGIGIISAAVLMYLGAVLIPPTLALVTGYWIGFVMEWAFGGMFALNNVPELTATMFFAIAAATMLLKVQINKKK